MIFDGHAYCFPSMRGHGGFPDPDVLRQHLQEATANHHQPAWRLRDRTPGDTEALMAQRGSHCLEDLTEAGFRAGTHGRFEWTVGEETYAKQYLPPSIVDMAYPAERLVAEMDYAGVDRALLHRETYLGVGDDFVAACVRRFPTRLSGLAHVEEWLIETDPDAAVQRVASGIREHGLSGLQFAPIHLNLYGQPGPWDGAGFQPFWDGVAGLQVPVFFTLKDREVSPVESYLAELRTLIRWMERYPDVPVVHTHGFRWRLFLDGDTIKLPDEVWAPFENPNLSLQLLFPIALGNLWDYPMPQVQPTIEACVQRIGADRLMWGTDMPMVQRFWTYRQNVDFIGRYCEFLSADDLAHIMGGTTARLLGIAAS